MWPAADKSKGPLRGLLVAQFFGAFNDNAWKLIVTLLAIRLVRARAVGDEALQSASQSEVALAFVVFTLPLVLVSLPAGLLADRVSKRSLIVAMKWLEILLMAAGMAALVLRPDDLGPPLVILALMGVQAAIFSPAKYGILPEILPHERLSAGNALLESSTFLAIISGSAASKPCVDESYAHIAAPASPSSSATRKSDQWNKCTVSVVAKRRRNDDVAAPSEAFRYSQIPRSRCERDAASITHVSSSRSFSVARRIRTPIRDTLVVPP